MKETAAMWQAISRTERSLHIWRVALFGAVLALALFCGLAVRGLQHRVDELEARLVRVSERAR